MTSWVTFETIDEIGTVENLYIDRLGVHQYREDERTRFELESFYGSWSVEDREVEDGQEPRYHGSMREVIQWVAGRVLYGA